WVRKPHVFRNVPIPDGSDIAGLRNEPALANGRVYVASLGGHVYMLDGFAPPAISAVQPKYLRCGDGTPVKIAGTNFNDIQDVSLRDTAGGTTQVGFDRDSSVQLIAHIPNTISAGRYDLIVHSAHGSSDPSQFFVTPIVDRISPTSGPPTG